MATSTEVKTDTMKFPGFKYGVFERPEGRMNLSLYSDIGLGESASVLAPRSAPLADKVAFYVIGRDLALGLDQAEALPEPVKRIARNVYADCLARSRKKDSEPWQATWHKDAVLIEPEATIPGNPKPGEDYVAARYFQNIDGFTEDGSDVVATPETVEERLWLPQGNWRYMFPDVGQNTRFGLPQRTGSLEEVVKAYVNSDLGLTEETAKKEASKFFRGNEGLFAVRSDSNRGLGPLCVFLDLEPRNGNDWIGSFPLSRSASGASQVTRPFGGNGRELSSAYESHVPTSVQTAIGAAAWYGALNEADRFAVNQNLQSLGNSPFGHKDSGPSNSPLGLDNPVPDPQQPNNSAPFFGGGSAD